jgi:hypothetical protein
MAFLQSMQSFCLRKSCLLCLCSTCLLLAFSALGFRNQQSTLDLKLGSVSASPSEYPSMDVCYPQSGGPNAQIQQLMTMEGTKFVGQVDVSGSMLVEKHFGWMVQ